VCNPRYIMSVGRQWAGVCVRDPGRRWHEDMAGCHSGIIT